jgi:F-type H+-transporting ATPase subunit alpha
VIETKADDISAYIPTNVISITDGQVFLKTDLFFQGVRPAVDAGQSVSRVGGNAQIGAMRKISGPLRLNLAQFRELAAFAEFGSELERGRRVVEVLKQPQFAPVPVEEQVLALYAVTEGHMDDIPLDDVKRFEIGLREFFRGRYSNVLATIAESGALPEDDEIAQGIAAFKGTFETTDREE